MKLKEQTSALSGKELLREINLEDSDARANLAYTENMYVDYDGGGTYLESVPGYREIYSFGKKINGIFKQIVNNDSQFMLIHAGNSLYRFDIEQRDNLKNLSPIATLSDNVSRAFSSGREVYILDGKRIVRVGASGEVRIYSGDEEDAYTPTLYKNGVAAEDRNILTPLAREIFEVGSAREISYETPGLYFEITDVEKKTCSVRGADNDISHVIYVPSYTTINGTRYKVTGVSPFAFYNYSKIQDIYFSEGPLEIGEYAFMGCTGLESVYMPSSVQKIGQYAFFDCESLIYVGLSADLQEIGEAAFMNCSDELEFGYPYTPNELTRVKGYEAIFDNFISYEDSYESISVGLKLTSPMSEIVSVTIEGTNTEYEFDPVRHEVIMHLYRPYDIEGLTCEVTGRIYEGDECRTLGVDFFTTEAGLEAPAAEPILSCRIGRCEDGSFIFADSEIYPGLIFFGKEVYSGGTSLLYFGARSYLRVGSTSGVVGIEKLDGKLAVFKNFSDDLGSIVYIKRKNGNNLLDSERYEILETHNGGSISSVFRADGVVHFLTYSGIYALSASGGAGKPCGSRISEKIRLGGNVSACFWRGYVTVSCATSLYLGDTRDVRDGEYAWYPITNVGSYTGDTLVYRYAESAPDGFFVSERKGERCYAMVASVGTPDGLVYYTIDDGKRYALYQTKERIGGHVSGVSALFSDGELLFFGTHRNKLCIFNNDMRGEAPDFVLNSDGYNPEEYARLYGNKIHPHYYSFVGHAPRCAIVTALDDLDLPHLAKRDARQTLGIKAWGGGRVTVKLGDGEVFTDGVLLNLSSFGFDGFDFVGKSLSTRDENLHFVEESRCGFIESQVAIYSDEYESPYGISSIFYRVKILGKPKRCTDWYTQIP